jgi:hypothetical protein
VLKLIYLHENWRPLWKLGLIQKLCFFQKTLEYSCTIICYSC